MVQLRNLAAAVLLLIRPALMDWLSYAVEPYQPSQRKAPAMRDDDPIESFLQTASIAPPELAADLLLQSIEKGIVREKARKVQILQQAFDLAAGAKFPWQLVTTGAGRSGQTDTDAGIVTAALGAHLDTLSLRMRAVQQMLRLDAAAALQMFLQVPVPEVPGLSCQNAVGYSLNDYYTTTGMLYTAAFDSAARRKRLDFDFLTSRLANLSPFALEPAAHLLNQLHLSQQELTEVVSLYTQALNNLQADDRSFTATTRYSWLNALYELAQTAQRSSLPPYGLVSSFGSYLDRHLRAVRCGDTGPSNPFMKGVVDQFNTRFHQISPAVEKVPLIPPEDLQPAKLDGRAEVYAYWSTAESKSLMEQYRHLRFGSPEQQESGEDSRTVRDHLAPYLGLKQRKSDAWTEEANTFLKNLDSWNGEGEPGRAGFHEKCVMYYGLLNIVPKGELRHRVFLEYAGFLRNSPVETECPPEWFLHLRELLKMTDEEDHSKFSQDIAQFGDATMQLYARLQEFTSPQ